MATAKLIKDLKSMRADLITGLITKLNDNLPINSNKTQMKGC